MSKFEVKKRLRKSCKIFQILQMALLLVVSSSLMADENKSDSSEERVFDWSFFTINRFNRDKGALRLQNVSKLTVSARLAKGLKLIGVGQTGETFNNGFMNVQNYKTDKSENMGFHFNQLYIEYLHGRFKTELGTMGVGSSKQKASSFHGFGNITGGRFNVETPYGTARVTLGNIGEVDKPDFYDRSLTRDYLEIQFQRNLWEGAMMELGHEEISDENYYRAIVSQDFESILKRSFEIILESIYDEERGAYKSGITLLSDVGELFQGKPSGHKMSYTFSHKDKGYDNFRFRNLEEGIYVGDGNISSLIYTMPLSEEKNLDLLVRARLHHDSGKPGVERERYELGLKWYIGK
ncbi:MAG: hypothetical protein OXB88_08970 [Bacteriovoracales bacterium]|nr:hypothetical protein [Bacteriovoracales bacterium]